MPVDDKARSLLQQYLRVLAAQRNHTGVFPLLELGSSSGRFLSDKTWINVKMGFANQSELQQLRDLLELIGHWSQGANFPWQERYHSFWKGALMTPLACSTSYRKSVGGTPEPTEFDNFGQLMKSDGPRYRLNFAGVHEEANQFTVLRDFLLKDQVQARGKEHQASLSELIARGCSTRAEGGGDPGKRYSTATLPRVELGIMLSSKKLTTSSNFRALAKLLEDIAEHNGGKGAERDGVRFEITTLWLPPDKLLVPIEIEILTDMIASETSTIQHLHITNAGAMLTADKRLEVFQHLLRTTVCLLEDSEPTLQSLHLERMPLIHPSVVSICSALRCSNSLKELDLNWPVTEDGAPTNGSMKLMWAWIAFGIFHPDSEARLERLNLTGLPLTYTNLTTFAFMIRSPHPGRQLWILEHGGLPQGAGLEETVLPVGQRVFAQLKGNAKIRVWPKTRVKALDVVSLDSEEFEVAIDMTMWICVIVPGCGLGWVPSASIVSRREKSSKCPAAEDQATATVQSRIGDWPQAGVNVKTFDRYRVGEIDVFDNIKFLLRMIGHCLEGFNFPSHRMHVSDTDLREIIEFCPNLTHLNLDGNLLCGLSSLSNRYENHECRISTLSVHSLWRQDHVLSQLADLLESPYSKPLHYVAASGQVDSTEPLEKLETVLKTNRTLRVVSLYAADLGHHRILSSMRSSFQSSKVPSRLLLSRKLAFLSTIQAHSKKTPSVAGPSTSLGRLDSNIVSQIFAFAGSAIPRTFTWGT